MTTLTESDSDLIMAIVTAAAQTGDRCLALKRKGLGNWERDDIAFLATIEDSHPHVRDMLYPTPIGTTP